MLDDLRIARTSHRFLNFDIEHKLNSGQFFVTFSEIAIVLVIIKMIEESNPLNMATLTEGKEQIGDDTDASHLHNLSTANCLHHDNQLVWRLWIERDFDLTLHLASLV